MIKATILALTALNKLEIVLATFHMSSWILTILQDRWCFPYFTPGLKSEAQKHWETCPPRSHSYGVKPWYQARFCPLISLCWWWCQRILCSWDLSYIQWHALHYIFWSTLTNRCTHVCSAPIIQRRSPTSFFPHLPCCSSFPCNHYLISITID